MEINIVGAGLAGSEIAFQLASRGISVNLYEMRPIKSTPAHKTDKFAELVCSNSFRSNDLYHPAGILKRELFELNSLLIKTAHKYSVPGGKALVVDREKFSDKITKILNSQGNIKIFKREITTLSELKGITILATGPLTTEN